jgi:ATP-dependent helicase/nuclease subunit A
MIFEKHTGIAMKLYHRVQEDGILRQYKTDTTLRAASALAVKLSEREEEMRLLYVAMTRARERLYLVGTGNQKEVSFPCGDRYATLSCNSYLKWILGGLAAHSEVANAYCLNYVSTSELPDTPPLKLQAMRTMSDTDSKVAAHYREILTDRPSLAVAEQVLRDIPTKLPAPRMQKNLLDTCVFFETDLEEDDGKLPDSESGGVRCDTESRESVSRALALMEAAKDNEFELLLQANRRPTAAERGTAVHLFLQYCHFPSVACNGPEQEIQRLLEEGFINQRTADILDRGMIRSFFASQFFARLQTAKNIRRELKFSRFVPLASLTSCESLAEALGDRTLYVQGSIDLLLEFPDGHLELCDYKTDRITSEERRDPSLLRTRLTHAHRGQMAEYAAAVSERYGKAPERLWVFSMSLGEALEISVEDDV